MNPERAVAYRKQAASLIEAVIDNSLTARAALNCWPMPGNLDPSVHCAYTMLWYFEADEDRHHEELYYSDVQINNMLVASRFLAQGEALPLSILKDYPAYQQAPSEYQPSWTWREPLVALAVLWEQVRAIVMTHPTLAARQSMSAKKQKPRPKGQGFSDQLRR